MTSVRSSSSSAYHTTAGVWPPQLSPRNSVKGDSHPVLSNLLFNLVPPSSLWFSSCSFATSWEPFSGYFGPSFVFHSCRVSSPSVFQVSYCFDDVFHSGFFSDGFIPDLDRDLKMTHFNIFLLMLLITVSKLRFIILN